jgi:hypothetical protein
MESQLNAYTVAIFVLQLLLLTRIKVFITADVTIHSQSASLFLTSGLISFQFHVFDVATSHKVAGTIKQQLNRSSIVDPFLILSTHLKILIIQA